MDQHLHPLLRSELLLNQAVQSEEELLKLLSKHVDALMLNNPARLFNILYRLDVAEEKARQALASAQPADALARLIYQRELLRQKIRRAYRNR